jgi:phosphoribosylaminoimidazole carboxylase
MDLTVGLLGGGQLGRMLIEVANRYGINVVSLDAEGSPAKQISAKIPHVHGSFTDPERIKELARRSDLLTIEIEHVDSYILEEIAEKGVDCVDQDGKKYIKKVPCHPHWRTIRTIQDKYAQKEHLIKHGVKVAESVAVESDKLESVGEAFGYPFMLKARKDAYDGRGNFPVKSAADIPKAIEALKGRGLYAEKWASFKMELAVMVVRTSDESTDLSTTIAYPAVETVHEDSICKLVYAPARNVSEKVREQAQILARKAVSSLWGKGVFGVELFVMDDGKSTDIVLVLHDTH